MPSRDPPVPVQPHLSDDPLDAALRPPIDETEEEKSARLALEEEAKRISQEIDDSIREEKAQRKKSRAVRLLLLGQSESGRYCPLHASVFPIPVLPTFSLGWLLLAWMFADGFICDGIVMGSGNF